MQENITTKITVRACEYGYRLVMLMKIKIQGYEMQVNDKYIQMQTDAGLSNVDAAQIFNVDVSTVKRWKRGTSAVPKSVMRCLEQYMEIIK
jgi:DNA-binding transcriptional regulator YiaG